MDTSLTQSIKLAIVAASGLSKDALHIYVGLLVFISVTAVTRRSFRSTIPLLAVLVVALAGEIVDAADDIRSLGSWRWGASLHDIFNTMLWPVLLFVLARFTSMLKVEDERKSD